MSRAEPWQIASDLSAAVDRSLHVRGEVDQTPVATSSAACDQLLLTAQHRTALLRAHTRESISSSLLKAVNRAVDLRNGIKPNPESSKQKVESSPDAETRLHTLQAVSRALRTSEQGECLAMAVEAAVARRRRVLRAEAQEALVDTTVQWVVRRRRSTRQCVAEVLSSLPLSRHSGVDLTRQGINNILHTEVVEPVHIAVHRAQHARRQCVLRGLTHTCSVIQHKLGAHQAGSAMRNIVAEALSHEVEMYALQLKAGDAFAGLSSAMAVSLTKPPEWLQVTSRPRTPQSLPPLQEADASTLSFSTVVLPAPEISSPTSSPSAKMTQNLIQVDHLSGRIRDPPARPAAALLSGTRHVPHSKISPFTGFYQSWQYEKRDSPTKFDKRRQFEHMHRCVKYCLSNSALPEVLPKVTPWEEDGADMSLQKVKKTFITKAAEGWDATKVHGMSGHQTLAQLQDDNLPGWAFDRKPLPVLGTQEHGRQLENRGL